MSTSAEEYRAYLECRRLVRDLKVRFLSPKGERLEWDYTKEGSSWVVSRIVRNLRYYRKRFKQGAAAFEQPRPAIATFNLKKIDKLSKQAQYVINVDLIAQSYPRNRWLIKDIYGRLTDVVDSKERNELYDSVETSKLPLVSEVVQKLPEEDGIVTYEVFYYEREGERKHGFVSVCQGNVSIGKTRVGTKTGARKRLTNKIVKALTC